MISLELTGHERLQFQYILPAQGDLKSLELVEQILAEVKINDIKEMDELNKIDFESREIEFILQVIDFLDKQKQLRLTSLSLIRKFLSIKGDNKNG